MCGICGVIQITGEPRQVVPDHVLDRMNDAMAHRGPNDRGTHVSPGASIGARRLSIIDVEGGHQPFSNEDGTIWAVQNGELFNHASLRDDLRRRGHAFASRCDTEILPHLYEEHGPMFPTQLRGMFGVAIWDQVRRRGVIARDRLGIKPIYYAVCGDALVFASELKSLLASGLVPTDLDYEAIDAFLSLGFFPAPATPLAAVKKLEPGCVLVIEDGTLEQHRFWSYPEPTLERGGSVEEWSERLLAELEESVRLRLMSDVPLGAMLSGGLDSSLIVALMAKQMDRPVQTFAVGFEEAARATSSRTPASSPASRHRAPRARALLRRRYGTARPARLVSGRAARRPLVARLLRAVRTRRRACDRRVVRPGRRQLLGGYRAPDGRDRRIPRGACLLRCDASG